jgi:hypothetical protein
MFRDASGLGVIAQSRANKAATIQRITPQGR